MKTITFDQAVEEVLAQAMADDPTIIVWGEDVQGMRRNLFVRFGPERVRNTPISEAAFVGAGVAAAMAGLRPVAELIMVDFVGVAIDALLNHAAKVECFSGGRWSVPLVVRMPCGGGYGDGGQHQQSLWGWLAHIPGLVVAVPADPADAGGLFLACLAHDGPAIFMEHKLLSDHWLASLGSGGRQTVTYDVPAQGREGVVSQPWQPLPLGQAILRRVGDDLTLVSVGVGVHRSMAAADRLQAEGVSAGVLDLRTVSPLDKTAVCKAVAKTKRLLVVDEDYQACGLSGELAAVVLEAGLSVRYGRVCTQTTIPYARHLEDETLPNVSRIIAAALSLIR